MFFSLYLSLSRFLQSPKFAPPIEFVDEAALSPPDGYKDNGLKNTLGGALSGHIFGAQHLQQLQVIQRLQQQRAAMLAARNNSQIPPPPPPVNQQQQQQQQQHPSSPASGASSAAGTASSATSNTSVPTSGSAANNGGNVATTIQLQHSPDDDPQGVCTECAECAECAAKQLQQDTGKLHDWVDFGLCVPPIWKVATATTTTTTGIVVLYVNNLMIQRKNSYSNFMWPNRKAGRLCSPLPL